MNGMCSHSIYIFSLFFSVTNYMRFRNESIYSNEVKSRIIFTNDLSGKANCFIGIKVILCTKCTLFNSTLDELGIFKSVPVNNLVIDEVSQIALFDYAVMFL